MKKRITRQRVLLGIACLSVAILSHLFFLSEFFQGRYMTGLNDGLSQMIPFKYFLYQSLMEGSFFYSDRFGFGGGIYAQLGYYFTTSIVFWLTICVTFLLEAVGWINSADLFYWADSIIFISMLRMTFILGLTTYYFKMIRFPNVSAFIAATFYGTSIIYFRHVNYWEFFADAMIFLPLLLIGVEKIIREGKVGWFILAVSLSMIDNFYFAYVNFLVTFIYILFRWIFPLTDHEWSRWQQIKKYVMGGLTGAFISTPFFIPAVVGYFHNYRPAYEEAIPLFGPVDNLLLHGRLVILPTFVLLSLMITALYKNRYFRFFAILTIVLCLLHYSPRVGSIFNGFSAPQYRWEHFLSFAAGGVVATALSQLQQMKRKQFWLSALITIGLYVFFFVVDPRLKMAIYESHLIILACLTIVLLAIHLYVKKKWTQWALVGFLLGSTLLTANMFQYERLTYRDKGQNKGPEYGITRSYMESEAYFGVDQRKLIERIQMNETNPHARIDWMIDTRNNTPIVQDFKGMSVYSSILNKELLHFYLHELEIDMRRESVSRYASLGDRANLYSLLNGKYTIREAGDAPVPFGFTAIDREGPYTAYVNEYLLPFARTTSVVYTEEALSTAPALAKEHAMLSGVILKEGESAEIPHVKNRINEVRFEPVNGSYNDGLLEVTSKNGGLDIHVANPLVRTEDFFITFYLDSLTAKKEFTLRVNDYQTERKHRSSIYRTQVNTVTIRVPAEETISIRLPKGKYKIKDFELYREDYEQLKKVKKEQLQESTNEVYWKGNRALLNVQNNSGEKYVVLPIPFEPGWTANVNGQQQKILEANYAFIALPLQEGKNEIELSYSPPYLIPSLFLSGGTLMMMGIVMRRKKEKLAVSTKTKD